MEAARERVEIITPSVLQIKHFGYVLSNGVKCIIIQDKNTKTPSTAMNIRAGTLSDPEDIPGLAHFCEHMLFMGTAKYPCEDEYHNYISNNSGFANAFTGEMGTTYYFTVAHNALVGALNRFIEFFTAPSFSSCVVAREVRAVHSEDENNRTNDFWRIKELWRSFVDPRHPYSRYGNGNITTLLDEPLKKQIDIRGRLLEFFDKYYVSGAACIVVYSALSPDEVLRIIEAPLLRMRAGTPNRFSFLPKDTPFYVSNPEMVEKGLWVNVRTVRKHRSISLSWPVHSSSALWKSMPYMYVSHVLGHECESSLLGILRRENLASELVAGVERVDDDYEKLTIDIALTVKGFQSMLDVIDLVYQGISQLKHVDKDVYEQMKMEGRISFESSEVEANVNHCVGLACWANEKDLRHCWISSNVILDDDFAAVEAYVAQLTPERCIVMLKWGEMPCDNAPEKGTVDGEGEDGGDAATLFYLLPDFARLPCNRATRFCETRFSMSHISDDVLARWTHSLCSPTHAELSLPPINPFLATDFTIHEQRPRSDDADVSPSSISGSSSVVDSFRTTYGVTLVRKNEIGCPRTFKTSMEWRGISPHSRASAKSCFYMRVLSGILNEALGAISYFGVLAALDNSVNMSLGVLKLNVTGPQQRIVEFFFTLFEKAFTKAVLCGSAEKYSDYSERVVRQLSSEMSREPYKLVIDKRSEAMLVVSHNFNEQLAAAALTSYDEYKLFVQNYLMSGIYFECFVAGNVPSTTYVRDQVVKRIEDTLTRLHVPPARKEDIPRFRDVYVPTRGSPAVCIPSVNVISYPPFDSSDPNVAVLLNIYIGEETPLLRALCSVMHRLISSMFFEQLRTREALGYIVLSQPLLIGGTAHMQFVVQSAVVGADGLYLLSRILAFLWAFEASLATLCTDTVVQNVVKGLVELLQKPPESVEQACADLVEQYLHPVGFGHKEAEIEVLQKLSATEIKEFFYTHIANSSVSRHALAVVVNNAASATNEAFGDACEKSHEITLPPKRSFEDSSSLGDEVSTEISLQLPDFSATPTHIVVQRYASPKNYHANLPVLCSNSF